jgi:hypothetical protein
MQAVEKLVLLADDEVSWLRGQGREAEADRCHDASQREINRALGQARRCKRRSRAHSDR